MKKLLIVIIIAVIGHLPNSLACSFEDFEALNRLIDKSDGAQLGINVSLIPFSRIKSRRDSREVSKPETKRSDPFMGTQEKDPVELSQKAGLRELLDTVTLLQNLSPHGSETELPAREIILSSEQLGGETVYTLPVRGVFHTTEVEGSGHGHKDAVTRLLVTLGFTEPRVKSIPIKKFARIRNEYEQRLLFINGLISGFMYHLTTDFKSAFESIFQKGKKRKAVDISNEDRPSSEEQFRDQFQEFIHQLRRLTTLTIVYDKKGKPYLKHPKEDDDSHNVEFDLQSGRPFIRRPKRRFHIFSFRARAAKRLKQVYSIGGITITDRLTNETLLFGVQALKTPWGPNFIGKKVDVGDQTLTEQVTYHGKYPLGDKLFKLD